MTPSPPAGRREHRGEIAARVNALVADITDATRTPAVAAPILLAHAARGFAVGGVVSEMLDQYAVPRRDNFATCAHFCAQAMEVMRVTLEAPLRRRYADGVSDAELLELAQIAVAELSESTPEDIDVLAESMIGLGAVLVDITRPLAADPDLSAAVRRAAAVAADAAAIVHSHYGGDAGGW